MEKYELRTHYDNEDEIDLVELLKAVIKEKKLIIIITIFFTLLAGSFALYKNIKTYNYGVEISLSDETTSRINQYNSIYKNSTIIFNKVIEDSFNTLLDENNSNIIVLSSEDLKKIKETLKGEYEFVKIIDKKNKNYKLFAKVKNSDVESLSKKIDEIVMKDTNNLNLEFEKSLSKNFLILEENFNKITAETNILNKNVMDIINENIENIPQESFHSYLSVTSPTLYTKYQEKIGSLNKAYLEICDLKKIKNEEEKLFKFTGKDKIKIININNDSENSNGLSSKLIIVIGAILGLFTGIFLAITKDPFRKILKEVKEKE